MAHGEGNVACRAAQLVAGQAGGTRSQEPGRAEQQPPAAVVAGGGLAGPDDSGLPASSSLARAEERLRLERIYRHSLSTSGGSSSAPDDGRGGDVGSSDWAAAGGCGAAGAGSSSSLASSSSGPVTVLRVSLEEKPQATRNKDKAPDYYANVGDAIRTLREDIPMLFSRDLNCERHEPGGGDGGDGATACSRTGGAHVLQGCMPMQAGLWERGATRHTPPAGCAAHAAGTRCQLRVHLSWLQPGNASSMCVYVQPQGRGGGDPAQLRIRTYVFELQTLLRRGTLLSRWSGGLQQVGPGALHARLHAAWWLCPGRPIQGQAPAASISVSHATTAPARLPACVPPSCVRFAPLLLPLHPCRRPSALAPRPPCRCPAALPPHLQTASTGTTSLSGTRATRSRA